MTDTLHRNVVPNSGHPDDEHPDNNRPAHNPSGGRSTEEASLARRLLGRISRLELIVGGAIAVLMVALVAIEPDIAAAPFENSATLLFTLGGTAVAALAFIAMLWLRVPAPIRLVLLVVPFAIVNWWLLSPHFIDDVVNEDFSTSIAAQLEAEPAAPSAPAAPTSDAPVGADVSEAPAANTGVTNAPANDAAPSEPAAAEPPAPTGPVLLGAGQFVGLAGHDGTGDAGIFQNPDGSLTLRFENFDIDNGPDLRVYLVPGADQVDLQPGSIDLGTLKGNVGDQNYEIPADIEVPPGVYTVLVWCEAFSVEFVGATVTV